jgi:hypothetical protein
VCNIADMYVLVAVSIPLIGQFTHVGADITNIYKEFIYYHLQSNYYCLKVSYLHLFIFLEFYSS